MTLRRAGQGADLATYLCFMCFNADCDLVREVLLNRRRAGRVG